MSIDTTIYIPKLLNLKTIYHPNQSSKLLDKNGGLSITWDADLQNKNGIAVTIESNSGFIFNDKQEFVRQDHEIKKYKKVTILKDDGSYTFKAADLDGFPSGASLLISVYRGGYTIVDLGNGSDCLLYGVDLQLTGGAFK